MPVRIVIPMKSVRLLCLLICTVGEFSLTPARAIDFEKQIRPLLQNRCGSCHGPTIQKSSLRLDARSTAMRGGDGGKVIVPGDSDTSELIRRVASLDPADRMPPDGASLSTDEIQLLRQWIDSGAHWPETDHDREAAQDRRLDHWAWQPIASVTPPLTPPLSLPNDDQANDDQANEIDRFIATELARHGLKMSPEADRRTLIRRLSFDLLGLPPTPDQIQRFVQDSAPDAYERLVDSFLASPNYGERWARHWLDIAHYADTHGFERDQRRDHAWRYRDWVIRALNDDMPYDQFLQDQIAGDVFRPDDPDAVSATGFLAAGPWDFVGQAETPSPVLKRLARADDLDDMVTQVMTAACAITINCARCHDHKIDPISQREYYSLWAVFAGVRRAERVIFTSEESQLAERRVQLEQQLSRVESDLSRLNGRGWNLADIVGGGDGHGAGKPGAGIDPATGKVQVERRGYLEGTTPNVFSPSSLPLIDGVVIPDGGDHGHVVISSTGLIAKGIPRTSGAAWDAIRNGPVNSQFSTVLQNIDFSKDQHTLLGLHANAAITFDLTPLRIADAGLPSAILPMRFQSQVGYFGQTARNGASVHLLLDGQPVFECRDIGRDDGLIQINITIPQASRFLTLMATDSGNGIGHDQICFADATLLPVNQSQSDAEAEEIRRLTELQQQLRQQLADMAALPEPAKIYAIVSEDSPEVSILFRGDPEQPRELVTPAALQCVSAIQSEFGDHQLTDGERRIALARWISDPANPLTPRVIVNRLWHHHFGTGIVDTPSDFGLGGGRPSHPELLDWLSRQLLEQHWSLKSIHRLICCSWTYRQSSRISTAAAAEAVLHDAGNRLLWRQNPRRLDAESLRDAVLLVSGKLNTQMYGPGYRDFDYKEEYAPVYTYITADKPELWRRSIYRFVVRTTPNQFMTTMDCPNPANLTPARSITTTALQSLALLNNEFMLQQSDYFADRILVDAGTSAAEQVQLAFQLAFGRQPTSDEVAGGLMLIQKSGLSELCRVLLNTNEFIYLD